MQQSALAHEIYKHTVRHDGTDHSIKHIPNFRHISDSHDTLPGSFQGVLVCTGDIDNALIPIFFNIDDRTGRCLDLLDNFSSRADDSSNLAFLNDDFKDTWCMRLEVLSWCRKHCFHFVKDMQPSITGL